MNSTVILMEHLEKLHTTEMGAERIGKNLKLERVDVVAWCRGRISQDNAYAERSGKNWYVYVDGIIITVNAMSYTIITAHRNDR